MSVHGHILNYRNTASFKTVLARSANDKNGSGETQITAGLFLSTSAITQLDIVTTSLGPLGAGSVVSLYGVKKAA
jgi:hypothetical protein